MMQGIQQLLADDESIAQYNEDDFRELIKMEPTGPQEQVSAFVERDSRPGAI